LGRYQIGQLSICVTKKDVGGFHRSIQDPYTSIPYFCAMAEIGNDIQQAAHFLKSSVVAIPTETVYGLAGNALDPNRVAKIFAVKKRPFFDPLILHVHSIATLEPLISDFPIVLRKLAEAFWPGPLTLLLPRKSVVPDLTCSGLPEAAFRIPNHPLTLQLLTETRFPLAAPSANPFGYVSPTTAQHVNDQLGMEIPYILDGGPCTVGLESTIVGLEDGVPTVFRLGGLSIDEIQSVIGEVKIRVNQSSDPRAPGMLKSHYAPLKPMLVGDLKSLFEKHKAEFPVLILFNQYIQNFPIERQFLLSKNGSVNEAAANLFSVLRQADKLSGDLILAEAVPAVGLGIAINDRLKRAAFRTDSE
jgi:L-threonylcarbamoyladenylate synthase